MLSVTSETCIFGGIGSVVVVVVDGVVLVGGVGIFVGGVDDFGGGGDFVIVVVGVVFVVGVVDGVCGVVVVDDWVGGLVVDIGLNVVVGFGEGLGVGLIFSNMSGFFLSFELVIAVSELHLEFLETPSLVVGSEGIGVEH